MLVMKIEHPFDDKKSCIVKGNVMEDIAIEEIKALCNEGGVGSKVSFSLIEMSEDELNDLEEFEGW